MESLDLEIKPALRLAQVRLHSVFTSREAGAGDKTVNKTEVVSFHCCSSFSSFQLLSACYVLSHFIIRVAHRKLHARDKS